MARLPKASEGFTTLQAAQGQWVVYLIEDTVRPASGVPRKGDRSLYVGMTNNLGQRIAAHNEGKVSSTRGRQWLLVGVCVCSQRNWASSVERYLKCGNSREKRQWFRDHFNPDHLYSEVWTQSQIRAACSWDTARKAREAAAQMNFEFEQVIPTKKGVKRHGYAA